MKSCRTSSLLPAGLTLLGAGAAALLGDDAAPARAPSATGTLAEPLAPRLALSFRWENDALAGTDENYSNGISLALSHEGFGLLGGFWKWFGAAKGRWVSSYELGQIIVTPSDIDRQVPDPEDRPYAGLLYGAISTQFMRANQFHGLKLITGVVGPASLAEETQKAVHRLLEDQEPQGWDYQLKNEPIFNLVYEHRRRYALFKLETGWGADAIPMVGAMLGNVLIQTQVDAQVRFGYRLPDDFGTTLMRGLGNLPFPQSRRVADSSPPFGVYLFAGGGANLVAHNLTLDGNSFRDGPSVEKNPFFPAAEFGVSFWTRRFETAFSYVIWGKEFVDQQRISEFGAVTLTYHF